MKFPLWSMRAYYELEKEGDLVFINTYHSTYILDDTSLPGDYQQRRVAMLNHDYGVKHYPLKYQCNTLIQVYKEYKRGVVKFIDSNGKIYAYRPTRTVHVEWKKCKCYETSEPNNFACVVKGEPYHFNLSEPAAYVALVTWEGARHILEVSNEAPERMTTWMKI